MAVVAATAKFGVGVYGASSYGVLNVSRTLTGVAGTSALGTVEAKTSEALLSVSATGAVGSVQVNLAPNITGVVGTFTLNGAGLDVKSVNRVPVTQNALTGSIEAVSAGGFEIDISESLGSVSATGAIGTVEAKTSEALLSVSATGSLGTLVLHAASSLTLTGVSATGEVNELEEKPTEELGSVSATGAVNGVSTSTGAGLTSVGITSIIGDPSITAVQFDYEAVAHLYSKRRAVSIPRAA
jgi:hypothetical protein